MEKKISIKTLYLLFLISFGLVVLGIGSTYAMFVATAEISNPISFVSNLSYNSDILDIIEIDIEPDETIISTLNVQNNTAGTLNYSAWYIDGGNDIAVGTNSGLPTGSITAGNKISIEVEIRNDSTKKVKVILGVTSNSDNVVIGEEMKIIPNVRISSTMAPHDNWYKSTVDRSTITKIIFAEEYTVTGNETESWPAATEKQYEYYSDIIMCYLNGTEITIVGTGKIFANSDTYAFLSGFKSVTSIENLNLLDTSKVTNMSKMFKNCSSLTSLDLSSFNTSNVTSMKQMFEGCSSLTSLALTNFDVTNVTDMGSMFYGCSSLTSLDLSSFNTSNVANMLNMFYDCSSLTSLALTNFDVTNVTDMGSMFYGCSSLTSLDLSSFKMSAVENLRRMFYRCTNLIKVDLRYFVAENLTNVTEMFDSNESLQEVYLNSLDFSKATDSFALFYSVPSTIKVYLKDESQEEMVISMSYYYKAWITADNVIIDPIVIAE